MMQASVHIYPWVLPILCGSLGAFFAAWDSGRRQIKIMRQIIELKDEQIGILEEMTSPNHPGPSAPKGE